uniref:Mesothelin n=1 Tax=Marmota marmota marmota TaxID=9994 RepID=A0A8C5ZTS8_MARMA
MALPTAQHFLGSCEPATHGRLLLLLLSLGESSGGLWVARERWRAALGSSWVRTLGKPHCPVPSPPLWGLFLGLAAPLCPGTSKCRDLAGTWLTRGPAGGLVLRVPDPDPLCSPAPTPGSQACARLFSHITKANVFPPRASERRRLLLATLACQGVRGSRVLKEDVRALGALACDLPGRFVVHSAPVLLPRLAGCPGPLDQGQQEAARVVLQGGGPPYGPPSRWSVSTLDALQGLLAVLDQPIIQDIPKDVLAAWLLRHSRGPSWTCPQKQKPCPPGRKPQVVDENLIFYEEWELEACVDGALLSTHMELVNAIPFTYQQIHTLKCRLDQTYPQGYPESLVQRLGYFFRYVSPEDIHKWNLTSLETVKALLNVSKGQKMDKQVTALIAHYVLGGGQLDQDTMGSLAGFHPSYLCFLSAEQLHSVPSRVMWAIRPQDLDSCGPRQLHVLYSKACVTFRNISQPEYLGRIRAFLGGAPMEDLRTLILQNMTIDMATFKKLRVEAVVGLTVSEVQKLLGPHVRDLKAEEEDSPVQDWISQQRQEDLDRLGLGLQGGIPNGYLVLDLRSREAFSGACPLRGPGLLLASIPAVLLALTLS